VLNLLRSFGDAANPGSYAATLRRRRFEFFTRLVLGLDRPLRILDVGGTPGFWELAGFPEDEDIEITILNVSPAQTGRPPFTTVVGDARDMSAYSARAFDVVFSNSVIEHVGTLAQQRRMAEECLRVGARLFLQTPNRFFPIEPHSILPFMQFAPLWAQVYLTGHLAVGGYSKLRDKRKNMERMASVRLLRRSELIDLFPNATVFGEKVAGLTKSFVVCAGWGESALSGSATGLTALAVLHAPSRNHG
jgi:SAM-dependent methyltransferase